MIYNSDDAFPHSGVCLLRRCDAVLRGPGMERALSLPPADNDREGSSPVAYPASSRARPLRKGGGFDFRPLQSPAKQGFSLPG